MTSHIKLKTEATIIYATLILGVAMTLLLLSRNVQNSPELLSPILVLYGSCQNNVKSVLIPSLVTVWERK